jgi:hypothetical protein
MTSLRRKPNRAGAITAFTLSIAILAALPAIALGAPEGSGEAPAPQLAFEPASYDFGIQPANSYSSQTTLQLRNNGETTEQILSLDVVGDSGAFRTGWTDCNPRSLNPGESCSVQVEFNPYDATPFKAQLRAHLEGGYTVTADLSGEGGRAIFAPTADPTSFGSVAVGSPGVTKAIEIHNSGNMTGGVSIAVIAGGAVGSFHLLDEDCTGIPLTPDGACNLLVSFQPLSTGVKTARLGLFGESDGGTGVVLTGVGTNPESVATTAAGSTIVAPSSDSGRPKAQARRGHRSHRRKGALRRRHRVALAASRASQ